ncbi:tetratricopeptide repeat protein [Sediminibacterium soli]|uniref:tetratricopeptide repeat protein n=1 Tax=Sediminibacterium soli TaxID=2698829 RepID=UPI001379EACD|nr:hypothetical protein [Sediminibacterium soli]NCI47433.1 hypothetical protein [Sediminibacterium soli]
MKKPVSLFIRYFPLPILLFAITAAIAQPPKKNTMKDKPPTQKETEEMMKEMQKQLDGMSPEDKKMLDSMGIKIPTAAGGNNMANFAFANANKVAQDELVPQKDAARIASIPKTPLTKATLPAYLQNIDQQIVKKLSSTTVQKAASVYQWIKTDYKTSTATGNSAVGAWVFGKQAIALYVMSKACMDNPDDDDNLNNFSAILTMTGGEQLALPILHHLNKLYPGNSTILNNIAHAWFGLGEMDKASRYIDSTLTLCPGHPQANLIRARLEMSKGNKQMAITAVKHSIKNSYTDYKEKQLDGLGYKLKSDDIDWNRPPLNDALGLSKFKWPAYPKNVDESKILKPEWEIFREACEIKIKELTEKRAQLESHWAEQMQRRSMELLQGKQISLLPELAPIAIKKFEDRIKPIYATTNFVFSEDFQPVIDAQKKVMALEEKEGEALKIFHKKYLDKIGEGKENPFGAACTDENAIRNEFLNEANTNTEQRNRIYLNYAAQQINDILHYRLYTQFPDEFELSLVTAQLAWLTTVTRQDVRFREPSEYCKYTEHKKDTTNQHLQDFESVNCQYKSELNLLFGTINVECSRMTAKLDLGSVKIGLTTKQGNRDDETFMDQFQNCSVEAGLKKGIGYGSGPLRVEAKAGISGYIEIDRNGIKDAGVKIGADIKVATNVIKNQQGTETTKTFDASGKEVKWDAGTGPFKDPSVTLLGTETKISILTGFDGAKTTGKGLLSGL